MNRIALISFLSITTLVIGCQKKAQINGGSEIRHYPKLQRKQTVPTFYERLILKERERIRKWNVKSETRQLFEYTDGKLESLPKSAWHTEYDKSGRKIYSDHRGGGGRGDVVLVNPRGPFKFNSDSTWSEQLEEGMTISIVEDDFGNVSKATWLGYNKFLKETYLWRIVSYVYDSNGVCVQKRILRERFPETTTYKYDSLMRKTEEVHTTHGLTTTYTNTTCWFYDGSPNVLQINCGVSGEVWSKEEYRHTVGRITRLRFDRACAETTQYNSDFQQLELKRSCADYNRSWLAKNTYDINGKPETECGFKFDSTGILIPSSLTRYSYEYFR